MKIIVTGAKSFLGKHLIKLLVKSGHKPYEVTSSAYDLRLPYHIEALFKHTGKPDIIFHLAANVGGIEYNLGNPAGVYYDNIMMTTQLIHQAAEIGCGKFIMTGSVCAYPRFSPVPTRELHLWDGPPESSNFTYGIAKRIALAQLEAYHNQYGLDYAYPILANLYGPGDNFNDDKSHAIPALIKRFLSGFDIVKVWGDGSPSRDFLYVEDAARALVACTEKGDTRQPINISTGVETSIRVLVKLISEITGFTGQVVYDNTKPNGQQRRCYSNAIAKDVLGWHPVTTLPDGLKRTIDWYANNRNDIG